MHYWLGYDGMVVAILDSLVENIGSMHKKERRNESKVRRTKEVVQNQKTAFFFYFE